MPKKPKRIETPPLPAKSVRRQYDPSGTDHETPVWKVNLLDREGEWTWLKVSAEKLKEVVLEKLKNFETMTWHQLQKRKQSHQVEVWRLCRDAQKRLAAIGQGDLDSLFSLRLSGKERIWGIRDRNILKILWWDPHHEVCPSLR